MLVWYWLPQIKWNLNGYDWELWCRIGGRFAAAAARINATSWPMMIIIIIIMAYVA